MINEDINREIIRGDFEGKSKEELKPLYMKRNAFDVSLDSSIYRIFELNYFIEDVTKSEITLVNISPAVFGDPYENPFLNHEFADGKDKISLGFLSNYYGLSWTEEEKDEDWRWESFTHGNSGVRVKVSLKKLMHELNNTKDDYFMLHYYVGKVTYHDQSFIDHWKNNSDYSDFLDSLGQLSALSLTALRNNFEEEKEIRVLYSYMPHDNDFIKNNIKVIGTLCKHPFNWQGIVEEVLVDNKMTDAEMEDVKNKLENMGVFCTVSRSTANYKKSASKSSLPTPCRYG